MALWTTTNLLEMLKKYDYLVKDAKEEFEIQKKTNPELVKDEESFVAGYLCGFNNG